MIIKHMRLKDSSEADSLLIQIKDSLEIEGASPDEGEFALIPSQARTVALKRHHLENERIISFDGSDERSRSYDMVRTQLLREMAEKGWQVLAVSSPTPGCGTSVTAANLALSIARQPERQVALVDLNLRRPAVQTYLGLEARVGIADYLDGRASLQDLLIKADIAGSSVYVIPALQTLSSPSDLLAKKAMARLTEFLRQSFRGGTIIFDMPAVLSSDEAIGLLPHVDCALIVMAARHSTASELDACRSLLGQTNIIRVLINKSSKPEKKVY